MVDHSLDLIFKEDQYCLTLTGKEFIFSSGITFLGFLLKYGYHRRLRPVQPVIHGLQYNGLKDYFTRECFLVEKENLLETAKEKGSLLWAITDPCFMSIFATHFITPDDITMDGLIITARVWGRIA